ncbi:hypothetical protein QTH87_12320 [Variovorax sp. J22P168]|uniref:hypothetical protein n=1 Tax=Variovorax jilinensis TaxID=3053513 RepID=UPI0025761020|nr:hypothetical protein [Variovorax sp. J22P168]MDM0013220.1 hypothetical protein [Variovorax sp. J22P168]
MTGGTRLEIRMKRIVLVSIAAASAALLGGCVAPGPYYASPYGGYYAASPVVVSPSIYYGGYYGAWGGWPGYYGRPGWPGYYGGYYGRPGYYGWGGRPGYYAGAYGRPGYYGRPGGYYGGRPGYYRR